MAAHIKAIAVGFEKRSGNGGKKEVLYVGDSIDEADKARLDAGKRGFARSAVVVHAQGIKVRYHDVDVAAAERDDAKAPAKKKAAKKKAAATSD